MQSIAILPAAGHSRRMGQPKLLLPWGDSSLIEQVLEAWRQSAIDAVVAVVRRGDAELADRCRSAGAEVVQPQVDPAEMRDSVQAGLEFAADRFGCQPGDAWLLAPADMPRLSAALIDRLLTAFVSGGPAIYVPLSGDRRGHPVVFPWSVAGEVAVLRPDQGINALLERHPVREVRWQTPADFEDLDTPEEYRRWRSIGRFRQESRE